MKKIYLLGLALGTILGAHAQTTIINDDFESYQIGGVNTSDTGGHWGNWYQTGADECLDMTVNNRRFSSGAKSGYIGVHNDNKGQDALLIMPQVYTKGTITTVWKMFVPADSTGYFNMQSTNPPGETDASFAFSCEINTFGATDSLADGTNLAGKIVWTASDGTSSFYYAYAPITTDTWFTVKQVMNLDSLVTHFYVNDVPVTYYYYGTEAEGGNKWPGQDTAVTSVDFFSLSDTSAANGLLCSYYVDDVNVTTLGTTGINNVNKNSNLVSLYPNPGKDFINISINNNQVINTVEVFNVAGQRVLVTKGNASSARLNIQSLSSGIYTVKIATKQGIYSKEFTVK